MIFTDWQEVPQLQFGTVHVWFARSADAERSLLSLLSKDEQGRLDSYERLEDRARYLVGCAIVRIGVASYLAVAPQEARIERTCPECGKKHGRPRVISNPSFPIELSVTHSGMSVMVAFTLDCPIGIDVERLTDRLEVDRLSDMIMTEEEKLWLAAVPGPEKNWAFLKIWTRKEALLKACGVGLTVPMMSFSVGPPGQPPEIGPRSPPVKDILPRTRPFDDRLVCLQDLSAPSGYVGAFATVGSQPRVAAVNGSARIRKVLSALSS